MENGSELSAPQAVIRFALELAALACWAITGWELVDGPVGWVLSAAIPLTAAVLWGTLRVPDDHSADGKAPIPVAGVVRLAVELDVLLGAAIATVFVWSPTVGIALGVAVVVHYALTMRRVRWLVAQRPARADLANGA